MYKVAVEIWFAFYQHKTGEQYVFDKKDGFHLKQLLKKIETKLKQKGMDSAEENILNSLKGFLFSLKDQWILEHLELSIVNSKFNVAYANAVRNNPFTAGSRIDDIVDKRSAEGAGQKFGN
jgi:hypothetical protein